MKTILHTLSLIAVTSIQMQAAEEEKAFELTDLREGGSVEIIIETKTGKRTGVGWITIFRSERGFEYLHGWDTMFGKSPPNVKMSPDEVKRVTSYLKHLPHVAKEGKARVHLKMFVSLGKDQKPATNGSKVVVQFQPKPDYEYFFDDCPGTTPARLFPLDLKPVMPTLDDSE